MRCFRLGRRLFGSSISTFQRSAAAGARCVTDNAMKGSLRQQLEPIDRIFRSPFPETAIHDHSYPEFALTMMERHGHKLFMVNGETGEEYSFHDALFEVNRVANGLIRLGVQPQDTVAFFSYNRPEYVIAWFAAAALGAVACDANPNFTAKELADQMKSTSSSFLFCHPDNAKIALEAATMCPSPTKVIVFGKAEGCVPYSTLAADKGNLFHGPADCLSSDVTHLLCSSGTTGLPKAVQRSHENLLATCYSTNHPSLKLCADDDRTLLLLPLFHIYGSLFVGNSLLEGCATILHERFRPEKFLEVLQTQRVTNLPIVPPLALFLAQHQLVSKYDLSSLSSVMCGAAPVSPEILQALKERLKLRCVRQGYGMTEIAPITFGLRQVNSLTGAGPPVIGTQLKIVNLETEETMAEGGKGEIFVKGPHIMSGYKDNLEATRQTIDQDGWLRTGDIGYVGPDGSLHIVDRLKDVIKVKGHQVAPAELETLLLTHPAVQDVAVIGVDHERLGEVPRAYVVLKDNKTRPEDLASFVSERASSEKHLLGGVLTVLDIPKSASGKILKKELRQLDAR